MIRQNTYESLISEIEMLLSYIGPYNDSLIEIIPPQFDEIQEMMPERLFSQTASLFNECRSYVTKYRSGEVEEAPANLKSLLSRVIEVKQIIHRYSLNSSSGLKYPNCK